MKVAEKRGDVTEGIHHVAVTVIEEERIVFSSGDIDRPFYVRSTAKPFQAWVSQERGAKLGPLQLAVAASSHQGYPVHIAIVSQMLDEVGLDPTHLGCPPAFPWAPEARDVVVRSGARQGSAIWHNCSGKHSAMLRACVDNGWDTASYLQPDHPLQIEVGKVLAEVTGQSGEPVGVDGCGAPVTTVSTTGLARAYQHLGNDPVFRGVVGAMHRYPGLTRGVGTVDDSVARWWNAAAKIGAVGCIGVSFVDGVGIALKCWDGSESALGVALMETLDRIGLMTDAARTALDHIAAPPVLGGGEPVGQMEVVT